MLQLFADGGGASAGASTGTAASGEGGVAESGVMGASPEAQGEDLSKVIYGKSEQTLAQSTVDTTESTEDVAKTFKEMIKKGGKYHDEFNKYSQDMINKRFKETKGLEEQLKSHQPIIETLAAKYGIDAKDINGLAKALDADSSMFEEAAFKEGLTTEQYRHKLELEKENARLKAAEEEAKQQRRSEEIYAGWLKDAEAMVQKYGIQNFDLAAEMENDAFTRLLGSGADFESAYKAIHFDEMLGGAMAKTASNVENAIVNKITSRAQRPAENGMTSSTNHELFKPDPSKWNDKDIDEVLARVRRGEQIVL